MASIGTINAGKMVSSITIHVRGLRMVGYRMRAGALLFRIGAWVAGVGIVIEQDRKMSLVDQINEELADGKRLNL